jgi:hypothetical protein
MQLIDRNKQVNLPLGDAAQLFFVECWYAMVHGKSLDSHRVRSMDALAISEELYGLIHRWEAEGFATVLKDIARSAAEAAQILEKDAVVNEHFALFQSRLDPHLKEVATSKNPKEPPPTIVKYYLQDLINALQTNNAYRNFLITRLRAAIFDTKQIKDIHQTLGNLLSRLISEGYVLEDLSLTVHGIFINNRDEPTPSFETCFDRAMEILSRPKTDHEVVFRLEQVPKGSHAFLQSTIAGVKFAKQYEIPEDATFLNDAMRGQVQRLVGVGQSVFFASVTVPTFNDRSAGFEARNRLSAALDLLRFEVMLQAVSVDEWFLSRRVGATNIRAFRFTQNIPNPLRRIDIGSFETFVTGISDLYSHPSVEPEMKNKIQAAFRQYRIGRDTTQSANKFVNWWTALENLSANADRRKEKFDSIIETVWHRLSPCLVLTYLSKFLEDYRSTFAFLELELPPSASEKYGQKYAYHLTNEELFDLLRDSTDFAELLQALEPYPVFTYQLRFFQEQTRDAKSVLAFLKSHQRRLEWHVYRIYRMRNAVVHNAEVSGNITLLSANLEYYLKTVLNVVLQQIQNTPTMSGLGELFDRLDDTQTRLLNAKADDETVLRQILRGQLT